ncbi:MAG: ImmA/IrrE family metallo-endopeptidase [Halothece sp. Uz-M2-17]|nr:ImmA/IrrE family metallo-endopeptidase [Halothece sp. Uz-M2-17]
MTSYPNYVPQCPLDATRVAEYLGLDVVWDTISPDEQGIIAARILPLERLIEINETLPILGGGFGESTIAHEVGHWVLHINQRAVAQYSQLQQQGISTKVDPLLCRNSEQLRGIEWQAQYFATCLLMPEVKMKQVCQGRNLTHWRSLYTIAEELGVTISNLIHRLRDLGWIELDPISKAIYAMSKPV